MRGRATFVVLGCAKNQVEAETLSAQLAQDGWDLTADVSSSQVVVVHSCGFLEEARSEARETLRTVRRAAPHARVILTGCFAQFLNGKKIPEADLILGTGQLGQLSHAMARWSQGETSVTVLPQSPAGFHSADTPRPLHPGQRSAFLRISEGCNHRCSFCLIPQLRGPLKSRPLKEIEIEARGLVARGVRELVLISQDTSAYGMDNGTGGLVRLVRALAKIPEVAWIRLLYVYPTEVSDELISLLAQEPKLCAYLDMPLQHFSNKILKAMKREGGTVDIQRVLDRLAQAVPGLALRTTLIVGFPGETDKDFKELLTLVKSGRFEHLGIFPFSFESRSPSSRLKNQVPRSVVNKRWQALLDAQRVVKTKKDMGRRGKSMVVLVEKNPLGQWVARGAHQAPDVDGGVKLDVWPSQSGFYKVTITGREGIDLTATYKPNPDETDE